MVFRNVLSISCHILKYPNIKSVVFFYEIKIRVIAKTYKMPKYAVARGYKVGIYDTWKECEEQVKGYHKAKYKKFDLLQDAEDFIKQNSDCTNVENSEVQNCAIKNECSDSFTVPKISPANLTINFLNAKFHNLEEKLNNFMRETQQTLTSIQTKLYGLECSSTSLISTEEGSKGVRAENKATKRPSEYECLSTSKVMRFTSEQTSSRNICTATSTATAMFSHGEGHEFNKSEDGYVDVYTDGACSKNGKLGAKAGIGVWFNKNHPLNVAEPVRGYATNNNAEIQAATKAILQASKAGITKLNVHTDSQFMIKCITTWIHKWKRNNWKLKDGGPVKNKEELIALNEAIKNMDCVKWTYVKGHSGNVGNTEADALARKGAEMFDCSVTFGSK